MGTKILYKNGVAGVFSDESIRIADPSKKGWVSNERTAEPIPGKVTEFLKTKTDVKLEDINATDKTATKKPRKPRIKAAKSKDKTHVDTK